MNDVPPTVWVPVVVSFIGLGGAVLGLVIAFLTSLNRRLRNLERRDKLSWIYIRHLIVHANTYAPGIPLPDPPDGWLDESP